MSFKPVFFAFIVAFFLNLPASVVINELFYDPEGSDGGWEWIEIYNASDTGVNMGQWTLEKAGTSFTFVFILPDLTLEAGCYLLIGEQNVENADLTAELAFQNGGSATDGVRLVSPGGDYSDTVLYDSPNINQLIDDSGNVGIFFAPDVSSGNSLARIINGEDSDNSETDFFESESPTPGSGNFYPVDLELTEAQLSHENGSIQIISVITNLSTIAVDNYEASLTLYINSELEDLFLLPQINESSSIDYVIQLNEPEPGYYSYYLEVNYNYDNNLQNNSLSLSYLSGYPPLVINEIMFKPEEGEQEWIEIYNGNNCELIVDNFSVIDAGGGDISFSCFISPDEYMVICQDIQGMLLYYPELDISLLVEADSWTPLNNTEEDLILQDSCLTVFEEFSYWGTDCPEGVSLERINPRIEAGEENWVPSVKGSTPCCPNSVYIEMMPESAGLNIYPNPFSPYRGEHTLICYSLPRLLNRITIRIFDLRGRLVRRLADQMVQSARGEFIWGGFDGEQRRLMPGVYIIMMEAVPLETDEVYRITETIVIAY